MPLCLQTNLVHPLDSVKGNIFISNTTGAVEQLKYEWSTGTTTKDLLDVGAGSYSLKITDSTGCEKTLDFTLYQLNSGQDHLSIYPNPVAERREFIVRILSAKNKEYSYIIYDMAGRRYLHNSMLVKAGVNEIPINLKLMKGAYIIYLQHEKEKHSIPFYVK